MNTTDRIDRLALAASSGELGRRAVLRALLAATAVGLVGPLRAVRPLAAQSSGMCAPGETEVPIRNAAHLESCTKKVPKSGYSPSYNGCGPAGFDYAIPDGVPGLFNFQGACLMHDICYGTCGRTQKECDDAFLRGTLAYCAQRYGARFSTKGSECRRFAHVYYEAVSGGGESAYNAGQVEACSCCEASCIKCECTGETFTDPSACTSACRASLACFSGICHPVPAEMCG